MTEHRIVEDTLAEITRQFLNAADRTGWDAPAQMAALDVRPVGDVVDDLDLDLDLDLLAGDAVGLAWELRGPVPVPGHPFASVMAAGFPDEAIGVLFAVEGWMTSQTELDDIDDALAADAAAHRGPDGRTEIRMAIALLTDGTCAQFCQVRNGGMHPFHGQFAGRLPGALNLLLGRPSGQEADCAPEQLCHRAWAAMALTVADTAVTDAGLTALAARDDQPAALIALLAAADPALSSRALPGWFAWLCAHRGESWDQVLDALRDTPVGDHLMGWLLASATDPEVLDDWDDVDERHARTRCDAAMLAMLADTSAPGRDQVLEAFGALSEREGLGLGPDDLDALAAVAVARLAADS